MDRLDMVFDECLKEKTKKEITNMVKKLKYKEVNQNTKKKTNSR